MAKVFNPHIYKMIPSTQRSKDLAAAYKVSVGKELDYMCVKVQLMYKGKIQPRVVPSFMFSQEQLKNGEKTEYEKVMEAITELTEVYKNTPEKLKAQLVDIDLTEEQDKILLEENIEFADIYEGLGEALLNGEEAYYEDYKLQIDAPDEYGTSNIVLLYGEEEIYQCDYNTHSYQNEDQIVHYEEKLLEDIIMTIIKDKKTKDINHIEVE